MWIADEGSSVGLAVNGTTLGRQTLRTGWNSYRWSIPAEAIRPGMNSLVVQSDRSIRLGDMLIARTAAP